MTPTTELYGALEKMFVTFNTELFAGKLPPVLFTTQRKNNVMGYYSPDRWENAKGERCSEIAINPNYVARSAMLEVMQTLVHEMVHAYQEMEGTPSRRSYHNKEWAEMMESRGLMPSDTGKPDGKKTGEKMGDYPIKGGEFLRVCESLAQGGAAVPWFDVHSEQGVCVPAHIEALELPPVLIAPVSSAPSRASKPPVKSANKAKYGCSGCGVSVWGRSALVIVCGSCNKPFEEN